MAVAGTLRIAGDDNRDGAAEALPFVSVFILAHEPPFASSASRLSVRRPTPPVDHEPRAAVLHRRLAEDLSRLALAHVVVERLAAIGHLLGAVAPLDGPELVLAG